jgi:hypothetical protein
MIGMICFNKYLLVPVLSICATFFMLSRFLFMLSRREMLLIYAL